MSRLRIRFLTAALLASSWWMSSAKLPADIVYLKDGTHIPNCQVVSSTDSMVFIRTPVGDMGVPRTKIQRIERQKSAYDTYRENLARVRKDDVKGLFKLATWCRTRDGLRKESDDLAASVFALDKNHVGARRLLGHILVGDRWYVPRPLSIQLHVHSATGTTPRVLSDRIALFLATRRDVRVVSTLKNVKPLDATAIDLSVAVTRKAGTRLYGLKIGRPYLGASVALQARSQWTGKTPPRTAVAGEIPADVPNASAIAVKNAIGRNDRTLHRFLDGILAVRAKGIHKVLSEKLRKTSGTGDETTKPSKTKTSRKSTKSSVTR
jgi:hypothetical protein